MKNILYITIVALLTMTYQTPIFPQLPELEEEFEEQEESEFDVEPENISAASFETPEHEEVSLEEALQQEKSADPITKHQAENLPTSHQAKSDVIELPEIKNKTHKNDEHNDMSETTRTEIVTALPSAEEIEEQLECPEIETLEK